MDYYHVYVWVEHVQSWYAITDFAGAPGERLRQFDYDERLTLLEATARRDRLEGAYPTFEFKVERYFY